MLTLEKGVKGETKEGKVFPPGFPAIPTTKELVVKKLKELGVNPERESIYLKVMGEHYGRLPWDFFPAEIERAQAVARVLQVAELFSPFKLPQGWQMGFLSDPLLPIRRRITSTGFGLTGLVVLVIGCGVLFLSEVFKNLIFLVSVSGLFLALGLPFLGLAGIIVTLLLASERSIMLNIWNRQSTAFQRSCRGIFNSYITPKDQEKIRKIISLFDDLFDYFLIAAPDGAFTWYASRDPDPVLVGVIEIREHPFFFRLYEWK